MIIFSLCVYDCMYIHTHERIYTHKTHRYVERQRETEEKDGLRERVTERELKTECL